jgi:hypothetical protein
MNANTYGHGPLAEHAAQPEAAHAACEWDDSDRTQPEGAGEVWGILLGSTITVLVLALVAAVMP